MTLLVQRVRDLDPDLYEKVYSLNLRRKGFSRGHIRDCFAERHEYSRIILALDKGTLIGWALLVQCLDEKGAFKEYSTNFYVRCNARRRGVGTKLFAKTDTLLKVQGRTAHVCIWSADSQGFYTQCTSPRIRVIVSPAYQALQS